MKRWSSPSDFEKVDLVCAELLRNSSVTDALHYMEKVNTAVYHPAPSLLMPPSPSASPASHPFSSHHSATPRPLVLPLTPPPPTPSFLSSWRGLEVLEPQKLFLGSVGLFAAASSPAVVLMKPPNASS